MDSSSTRSSSSRDSTAYRSSNSSTKTKNVYSSKGNVIVQENARGYERNAPHPGYSSSSSGTRYH
ncbi:hypothetical protein PG984_011417 [Apiospora sp. TS-2023a]